MPVSDGALAHLVMTVAYVRDRHTVAPLIQR